jgi:RNA polymerase sigma-70 factor (ECF subfamily)
VKFRTLLTNQASWYSKEFVTTSRQEAQWVLRAQCDDREALEDLLRGIQPSLRRFVCGIVGPSHADDVLQDVFVIVCRKLKALHTPELFRPWVYRIASRQVFRHLKNEQRWPDQTADASALDDIPAQDVRPSTEVLQELLSLNDLSPASRAVLALHFQEELPLAEIAAILELPLGTVKSRLAYGLSAIRKHLSTKRSDP